MPAQPLSRFGVALIRAFAADSRPVREIIADYPPLDVTDISKYRAGRSFGPKRKALIETLAAVEYGLVIGAVVEAK